MSRLSSSITPSSLHSRPGDPSRVEVAGDSPARLDRDQPIFLRDGEHCWIVRVTEIVMLESQGNYTRIYFEGNRPMLYRSLNDLHRRLDPSIFFRANRRIVINLRFVKEIELWPNGGYLLRLTSGFEVQVSRRQGRILKQQLAL